MKVLIVDDEPLARSRLRRMLAELPETVAAEVEEAGDAAEAWPLLRSGLFDVALLDIQMPGQSGMALAQRIAADPAIRRPAVVFVTAHEEHALDAFGVSAIDYLTKPVRRERLAQAMAKATLLLRASDAAVAPPPAAGGAFLPVQERGMLLRVPLGEVLYCRADAKYTTVRTATRTYLIDTPLVDLEARYPGHFVRLHRSALVTASAIHALERPAAQPDGPAADSGDADAGTWTLHLRDIADTLPVSRRRVGAVQALIRQRANRT